MTGDSSLDGGAVWRIGRAGSEGPASQLAQRKQGRRAAVSSGMLSCATLPTALSPLCMRQTEPVMLRVLVLRNIQPRNKGKLAGTVPRRCSPVPGGRGRHLNTSRPSPLSDTMSLFRAPYFSHWRRIFLAFWHIPPPMHFKRALRHLSLVLLWSTTRHWRCARVIVFPRQPSGSVLIDQTIAVGNSCSFT